MVAPARSNRTNTPRKSTATTSFVKKSTKPDASILSFFQKTAKPEDSLFVGAVPVPVPVPVPAGPEEDLYSRDDDVRYNEVEAPNKKRRLSEDRRMSTNERETADKPAATSVVDTRNGKTEDGTETKKIKPRIKTPFVMDSDSEDEQDQDRGISNPEMPDPPEKDAEPNQFHGAANVEEKANIKYEPPKLDEESSTYAQFDELGDFADLEDFDLDEFEGEEMREMRFMREQARLEAEETGTFSNDDAGHDPLVNQSMIESCPICNGSLAGTSADDATRHVNSCLDGDPMPLPKQSDVKSKDTPEAESVQVSKRFARAAVPRPSQTNPFETNDSENKPTSAFSKLMSNNAENSAWATAAAAENSSRGRPAYERTCPFYKIIPGFSISVDAFRYGAVEGCKAYFLSHFHSDHYIGLTANWRHGPIYCSKVTGSLVKQQLRTAAKWVVELEFDEPYDIPGTEGASVTMIPANHCPGSSLFLFQKPFGTGPNKRTKRILHCGDFRACPSHVRHPLLRPDIFDSVSGKERQQRIDICYLDTTYLNPRYSFPPQEDVIKACAALCGSISPDPNCHDDVWQKEENVVGASTVSRYFQSTKPTENGAQPGARRKTEQRLLVVCGTYSIGKERICIALAKALNSKIFAFPAKIKICQQLNDPDLNSLLTSNPLEAQVHMNRLMEIRAETLQEYLDGYRPHFSRIVGFRPSGWNFRPGNSKSIGPNTPLSSIPTHKLLHGKGWRTRFGVKDLVVQRGSTKEAMCFGVPYSEHSSFRELAMFIMGLRIDKVIPTVNVGSEQSRKRMKAWIDRWMAERRKGGLVRPLIEGQDDNDGKNRLWQGKPGGNGGGAWW